ncbi:class I SAM-dependent methyltransferase [Thermodesulforhabdus norvegica]|uniref:Trm112p-like protein n=1 Tax=Thermodesulforhabdus norvegica TaxID=39841 RepID=A0A1I4SK36_9BACT|nr:methyltransferase domain-containing protein [Thermodesulforhabdus norvegica]SFM64787.1 Trm112p-like protein [Thermodesulforhabdus norvegica]
MKEALLEYLVCPSCLPEEYELKAQDLVRERGEIERGSLICSRCGRNFRIEEGIAYLTPDPDWKPSPQNKYETLHGLSSYLWSHYHDLMGEKPVINTGSLPYSAWADMVTEAGGMCLDIGCAVGRFALEVSRKCDFVVGIDLSVTFIKAARRLARDGRLRAKLVQEGNMVTEREIILPGEWSPERAEFIVADCLRLPFRSNMFRVVTSLNVIDKVPSPLAHMKELNRVAKLRDAECLVADPFSWSPDVAPPDEWLGGKSDGLFAGYGIDNVRKVLEGVHEVISPPWRVEHQSHQPWIIRNHRNHYEYIISYYVKARR